MVAELVIAGVVMEEIVVVVDVEAGVDAGVVLSTPQQLPRKKQADCAEL